MMNKTTHSNTDQEQIQSANRGHGGPRTANIASFIDNRPEAIAQRKLIDAIHKSPRMMSQRTQFQHMSSNPTQLKDDAMDAKPIGSQSIENTAQLASKVECQSTDYSYDNGNATEVVGRSMRAELDPGAPINGSAPGDGVQKGLMDYLKLNKTYKSMKRGHLMNGQLGGPGIASNLHPITTKANNDHKGYVENYVKQAIANDVGIIYKVNVNSEYNADSAVQGAAEFNCQSWAWDPKGNIIDLVEPQPFAEARIESLPQPNSTGEGGITGLNVNPRLTFLTKDLPKGWGEKGKGLKEWDDKEPSHYSSTHK
ncbi:MAG: hypothetical protein GKS05_08465 [Nitrospirales bacterium]|nr:hypothetical protein [Nitrospirales bacterium]